MNHESIKDIVSRALPDESQKQSESVQVFNKSFNEINIVAHNGFKSRHIVFVLIAACFLVFLSISNF